MAQANRSVPIHPLYSPWGRFGLYSFYIDAPEPAIVDTGVTGSPTEGMLPELEKLGKDIRDVRWILLTHGHIDHLGGAHELWELTNRQAKVVIHEADVPYLRSRQHHVDQYFLVRDRYIDNPAAREEQEAAAQGAISGEMEPHVVVRGGETLDLGGVGVRVHHIPGHTAGSVAYEVAGQGSVFVGDAVQVHGAANGFPGFEDPEAYRNSLEYLKHEVQPVNLYLGHPYRTAEGEPYGVELDPTETQQALEQSLTIEAAVRSAAKETIDAGLQDTGTVYSPFDHVAQAIGYTGDPRPEPSPFFTSLHGYRQLFEATS
jgi:glyoxylase-like metal-dependent hydrolase (beta-lactamase superfamily II)